jgi:glycosyltransferase involved in cell wall biosynthesis
MRILWFSNSPTAPTGYGTQTAQVVERLVADGHEVAIASSYGAEATASEWRGLPVFPKSGLSGYSEDMFLAHAAKWRADWTITLYDVWPLLGAPGHEQHRIASWTPIDHMPVPPDVLKWAVQHPTIAMSRFGQEQLAQKGVSAYYIPHAIDTRVFRPVDGSAFRAAQNIPADAFVVTINAANKGGTPVRKAWSEMLYAYAHFASEHPDAHLYIHTNIVGMGTSAPRLDYLLSYLALDPAKVHIVDQYEYLSGTVTDADLAAIYSGSDVLLATSMGEGFGIPVIEAQACGTPVIVTDFSAQSELCGAGWRVKYQPWFDHFQASWLATPLVASIHAQLEAAYAARGDAALRAHAVEFAQQYDADRVYAEHWRPVLADLERLAQPPADTRQQRRAAARKARRAA